MFDNKNSYIWEGHGLVDISEGVDLVLFTIDVGSYDQSFVKALLHFESVLNSLYVTDTVFLLCFTKGNDFGTKSRNSSIRDFFYDYISDSPYEPDVAQSFVERFEFINKQSPGTIRTLVIPDLPTKTHLQTIEELC